MHEPLIPESLFWAVQDVVHGRKRAVKAKIVTIDLLALKGFINCPKCRKALTGSASKGRNPYYHYYHCNSTCGYRVKAEEANNFFNQQLGAFVLNPQSAELFKHVILDVYAESDVVTKANRKQIIDQIKTLDGRISKERELLLNGDIDAVDFRAVRSEADNKIQILESKLADLKSGFMKLPEVEKL